MDLNENIVNKQLNNKLGNELNSKAESTDIVGSGLDLENNLNIENFSTTSGSSVEPHSDCSDLEQILNANDDDKPYTERNSAISEYLASHLVPLPDLTSVPTESEDDYMSVTSSAIGDGTWENNWLFRKKKFNSSSSAAVTSAGMLVPDPSEDIRAQIGDKTADEVSDLSELGSDTDDSLDILHTKLEPINDRLANKHLIGGENDKMILDELIKRSSIVSNTLPSKTHESYPDTLNENVIDAPIMNEAINNNVNQRKTVMDNDDNCDTADGISPPPLGFEDINSNSLSDQLSHDPNPYDNSRTTTVEDYTDSDNDQKENRDMNLTNNTSTTTNTTSTTTFTEHRPPNKNTNNLKTINCKQAIDDNLSITSNTTNNSHDKLLTSAAQSKKASVTYFQSARGFFSSCSKHRIASDKTYSHINNGDGDCGNSDDDDDDDDSDDLAVLRHFVPGSIAEREYKKWYNAVEMPNNPYAPEALKRRISGSQERFIDLPNISPIKEFNNLQSLKTETLDSDETQKREIDHKRYSRDYYINSASTSSQSTPVRERCIEKDIKEATNRLPSYNENDFSLHKAMPAQVVENSSLSIEGSSNSLQPSEVDTIGTTATASEESITIKMDDSNKPETGETSQNDKTETKPNIVTNKTEYCGDSTISMPVRGSTPTAFKFLQPKRRLLEPSQILSTDEHEENIATTTQEKPVIEEEVAKALPSVKALARAFLMTTNTTQPEKLWLRKARTLSQSSKKKAIPTGSLYPYSQLKQSNPDEDVTITSDLSSLETDSVSIQKELDATNNLATASTAASDINPLPVRQGVLKSNIAFFENLKNK